MNRARGLFPHPAWYAVAFIAGLALLTLAQGMLRHFGDPESYPFGKSETWEVDHYNNPYRALIVWDSIFDGDFRPVYAAAHGYRIDRNFKMYQPDELKQGLASFVYTPFVAMAIHPIAAPHRSLGRVADTVSIINHVMWLASFAMLLAMLLYKNRPGVMPLAIFAVAYLAFYPLAKALQLTQASIWIYTFLAAATLAMQRKWYVAAGIALALGVSIKPHLVVVPILLFFLPGFPKKPLIVCAIGLGLTASLSLLYAGWDNCMDYAFETLPVLTAGYAYYPNQSINGMTLRLFENYDPATFNLVEPHRYIKTISSVFGLAVLGFAYMCCRRYSAGADNGGHVFFLVTMLTAATIASPVCWYHHFSVFAISFTTAAHRLFRFPELRRPWLEACLLVSLLLTGYHLDTRYLSGFPAALLSGPGFYGALMLLGCLTWMSRQPIDARES